MKGTFAFCRTNEAVKRMEDGDIIQHLPTEEYYKQEQGQLFVSLDCYIWRAFNLRMESFPPYDEWRSLSNLHYYDDLKPEAGEASLFYLMTDGRKISETDKRANRSKKRWFIGTLLD